MSGSFQRRRLAKSVLAGFVLALAAPAFSQEYPNKPIRLVIGFAAGSATDVVARTLAEPLGQALGQQVIVENRPGAASTLAAEIVAHAQPDGYTLTLATNSSMSTGPAGLVPVKYDPVADFTPFGRVANVSFMLAGNNALPAKTLAQLVDYAKQNPAKTNCASGNANGIVFCELFKKRLASDIVGVPYKSTPAAVTDLIGGQVQIMFVDVPTGAPRARAGQLKAYAVTSEKSSPILPEVPTMSEAGMADFPPNSGWWGLYGPANVPQPVAMRLSRELQAVMEREDVRKKLLAAGVEPAYLPAEEMEPFLRKQLVDWRAFLKEFKIAAGS